MSAVSSTTEQAIWVDLSDLDPSLPPTDIYAWLIDQGSLTKALVAACSGSFSVDVQQQGWGQATASERALLGMPDGMQAMLREVDLLCNLSPWVFARTVIPACSLEGRAEGLAHLGNKPLGEVLFSDPDTRRQKVEVVCLGPNDSLYQSACAHLDEKPKVVWGRRTLFEYAAKLILVNEIFLPR